ncbi:hypothetical protein LARV_03791 [Longilinea arvoryzae]|uniref:Uncharacterized protein n=1 Tax=Longilinea arvoryzae TaxID=360412 RepID=A0A0K8MY85_9CHLR|nr:hypothetical protein [Longilinea arvoryzae]GAP15996.1 hypothetical protein LARV_03791 [Longilinea arvoryzae]
MKLPTLIRICTLAALAVSLTACDVARSFVEQQVLPRAKEELKTAANQVVANVKDEVAAKIEELEPETFSCAADPALCPEISDPGMGSAWLQVVAPIQNTPDRRHLLYYLGAINQFNVEKKYECRYRPYPGNNCALGTGPEETRCNIFAGDVMRSLGAALPTKGELGLGAAGHENDDPMTANAASLNTWLLAGNGGWRRIDPALPSDLDLLLAHVRAGKPALASRSDHIAVIRPDQFLDSLSADQIGQLRIAQAGAINDNNTSLENGFGTVDSVQIYIHD